ncbi:hypothetical protein [Heyndrickxia acidiproducens]|uniref:hypothetical protein n=1 Tax=Heyndrickxia acidiproducens TaxID=1121084 RepID=UPI00036B05A4|nr:hypothetical protein [Heyndrickxia acidiproducens]
MNFDSKYLVRWGIPGWTLLFILLGYSSLIDFDSVKQIFFSKSAPVVVGSITLFIGAGVILGNIIHQISMTFGFIIWTKRKKYFKSEYEIDTKIIKGTYGKDIQRIYSYRLGNVHALRALFFSFLISIILLVVFSFTLYFSYSVGLLLAVVIFLNIIVLNNLIYFQRNLDFFIKKVKNDF